MKIVTERWFQFYKGPVIIASSQGGVNIEEVAAENPDAIVYEPIDIKLGLTPDQAAKVVKSVGLGEFEEETVKMLMNMYQLFVKKDALLIEINPYAEDALEGCKYFMLSCSDATHKTISLLFSNQP